MANTATTTLTGIPIRTTADVNALNDVADQFNLDLEIWAKRTFRGTSRTATLRAYYPLGDKFIMEFAKTLGL
jgi:hypothetical protein